MGVPENRPSQSGDPLSVLTDHAIAAIRAAHRANPGPALEAAAKALIETRRRIDAARRKFAPAEPAYAAAVAAFEAAVAERDAELRDVQASCRHYDAPSYSAGQVECIYCGLVFTPRGGEWPPKERGHSASAGPKG